MEEQNPEQNLRVQKRPQRQQFVEEETVDEPAPKRKQKTGATGEGQVKESEVRHVRWNVE